MIQTNKQPLQKEKEVDKDLDLAIKIMEIAIDELYILLNKTNSLNTFKIINLMQDFINIQKNKVL